MSLFCGALLSTPATASSAAANDVVMKEHSSLMYQQRHAYAVMLFGLIDRHLPAVVGSDTHQEAERLLNVARISRDEGDIEQAMLQLNESLLLLKQLSSEQPLQLREKRRYLSLKEGIPLFTTAYQRHYDELAPQAAANSPYRYNQEEVDLLMHEAEVYVQQGRFGEASILMKTAQEHIAVAIKSLLDHKRIGVVAYPAVSVIELGRPQHEIDREQYQQVIVSINAFKKAHLRQKSVDAQPVIGFDKELVEWLLSEAAALASKQRYVAATEIAERVRTLITAALRDTLDGHDIVVKLDISTPKLEFIYEHRRYLGYEELIPIAIRQMQPDAKTLAEITQYRAQGGAMAQKALDKSAEGEYPVAIRMIMDATRAMQRALHTAGVPIYDAR
ncbi:MAG: hypothetical protein L3J94_07130 [Gammaproteobacteria bacterium]|nr:hypothetical protein [Gammaproteobacteria bacterium]